MTPQHVVGIIQSNFLPWRGYFDLIREVDLFVVHDDLQYTKGDWRNRNRIKTPRGPEWITVPVHYRRVHQSIDETEIDYSVRWATRLLNRVRASYAAAPHFEEYFDPLAVLLTEPAETISELNLRLMRWVCRGLGIHTPIVRSKQFHPIGSKTERLIGILKEAGATAYLSGPSGRAYLVPELFAGAGITLAYKAYDYLEYPQLYPPYDPHVTILDLLFMTGSDASTYLVCRDGSLESSNPGVDDRWRMNRDGDRAATWEGPPQ